MEESMKKPEPPFDQQPKNTNDNKLLESMCHEIQLQLETEPLLRKTTKNAPTSNKEKTPRQT